MGNYDIDDSPLKVDIYITYYIIMIWYTIKDFY